MNPLDPPTTPPLKLFGVPTYVGDSGMPIVFRPERRFVLLAYLACRHDWVTRDELAELLWAGRTQSAARSNLRKVLLLVQQVPGLPPMEQQGDRLRWMPESDLSRFDSACARRRWDDALSLYRPPLLQGLDADLPGGASDWLDFERQRAATQWQDAVARRLEELAEQPSEAASVADALLRIDPFCEAALLAFGRASMALGQHARGMQALQRHRERLAAEFGIEPPAGLRELAAQLIESISRSNVVRPSTPRAPAPPASGFLGRRIELAQLQQSMLQAACRVLTLTGPGGVGKSSLARAALGAMTEPHFEGAAWWVALDDLNDVAQLPGRIASLLALDLSGSAEPLQQIVSRLAPRPALLVLDNSEHLEGLVTVLATLLAGCPALKILNTSRSRLSLPGEWLQPLEGLPLPDADEVELEVLMSNDAVRLFDTRARAASPSFDLGRHAADVVGLLHAVEGLPLAIELSASWVRLLPVREIVLELAASPDLLNAQAGGGSGEVRHAAAPRDRSMRASFAHSWQMLTPGERDSLAQLAQLPGPFGRHMALQAAQSPLPVLAALSDKSLLRTDGQGRFSLHPLIRQCTLERAAEQSLDVEALRSRHIAYMAKRLERYDDLRRLSTREALIEFEGELTHARAAWQWSIERREPDFVSRSALALMFYFETRGLWQEGLAMLARAGTSFDVSTRAGARATAVASRCLALLQFRAGHLDDADASARRAIKLTSHGGDGRVAKASLNILGLSLWRRGRFTPALHVFEQALRRAKMDGDQLGAATYMGNAGLVEKSLGRYDDALTHCTEAVSLHRRIENPRGVVSQLNNVATIHHARRDWAAALPPLEEALRLCERHEFESLRSMFVVNIGIMHYELGDHVAAQRWLDRGLADVQQRGDRGVEATTLQALARLSIARGQNDAARKHLGSALTIANALNSPALQLPVVSIHAKLLRQAGQVQEACAIWRWLIAQPGLDSVDRNEAQRELDRFRTTPDLGMAANQLPADGTLPGVLALIAHDVAPRTEPV
jgi:predicted ATPase/DNA-binding SARP family transcriptional activator/Tfp pilus assembly protein PilF